MLSALQLVATPAAQPLADALVVIKDMYRKQSRMEGAVDVLKRKGVKINDQLLSHLSPPGWEHINLTGDYIWKSNRIPTSGKFRRLRPAKVERSKNSLNNNSISKLTLTRTLYTLRSANYR